MYFINKMIPTVSSLPRVYPSITLQKVGRLSLHVA